jgi:II/X family phage/plasmid replication protein
VIDTLSFRVICESAFNLRAGFVMAVAPSGEQEWQTPRWLSLRGSHCTSMAVRATTNRSGAACLNISGSPAKFHQGHNVFGSDDLSGLVRLTVDSLLPHLAEHGVVFTAAELSMVEAALVELLRVDINESYSTGSRNNANSWISAASHAAHFMHRGRGHLHKKTAYWGKGSRYSSFKAYCKGEELESKGHSLPESLRGRGIEAWADDLLRLELTLLARELRRDPRGLNLAANWTPDTPRAIFLHHLAKLQLSEGAYMIQEKLDALPGPVRMTYIAWKEGADVSPPMLTKPTFYRHRKMLLDAVGIDIGTRSPNARPDNVIPLRRVIEAVPVGIPEWAIGTPLYVEPRRRA